MEAAIVVDGKAEGGAKKGVVAAGYWAVLGRSRPRPSLFAQS